MGSQNYALQKSKKASDDCLETMRRTALEINAICASDSSDDESGASNKAEVAARNRLIQTLTADKLLRDTENASDDENSSDDDTNLVDDECATGSSSNDPNARLTPPPDVLELSGPSMDTMNLYSPLRRYESDVSSALTDKRARSHDSGVEVVNVVPPEASAITRLPDFDAGSNHLQQAAFRKTRRALWEDHEPHLPIVEQSPSPIGEGVRSPAVTPGRHKIGDDVLASGIIQPVTIPEELVMHLRSGGRSRCKSKQSSPVYMQHGRLSHGSCPEPGTFRAYGVVPSFPIIPFKGFYDLTENLANLGIGAQWDNAEHYRYNEFEAARQLLAPVIRHLTGGDYFFEFKIEAECPKGWVGGVYPPTNRRKSKVELGAFGYRYKCDHKCSSGCLETAAIYREYAFSSTRSIYSLELTRGRHRIACNHCNSGNTTQSGPKEKIAKMHPAVDMYIREAIRNNPKTTYRQLEAGLSTYLRSATGLHCSFPRDGGRHKSSGRGKGDKSICTHLKTYQVVAENPHYGGAQDMPPAVWKKLTAKGLDGSQKVTSAWCQVTPEVAVPLHHMTLSSGASNSCTHKFEPELQKQVKEKSKEYKAQFGGFKSNVAAGLPNNASIGEHEEVFARDNLFAAWEKFANPAVGQKRIKLGLHDWRLITLLYRRKSTIERNRRGTKRQRTQTQHDKDTVEVGGKDSDCCCTSDSEYEFVAVYASLHSLIVSVKAWACRHITGWVQAGLDNMYNALKDCPNVS